MKIQLTSVHVNDPIEAFKFYTEILGFEKQMYMPEAYVAIVVSPEDSEGTALLLEPSDNPIAKKYKEGLYEQGIPAITFGVENLHAEYERLKQLGVTFKKEPTQTDWGYEAVFDDTSGNFIHLAQL